MLTSGNILTVASPSNEHRSGVVWKTGGSFFLFCLSVFIEA